MHIGDISIINFKNLKEVQLEFSSKLNCFIGRNGAGKTNLLDAVYFLSFCKSFSSATDLLNISHDEQFFMLNGNYSRFDAKETVSCGFKKGGIKQFKRNSKIYKKLIEHIGLFPLVMITPSDVNLILGGSEERRKFADGVISQYNQVYLDSLLKYNRALQQRNILLRQFATGHYFDAELLSLWDTHLVEYGSQIYNQRKEFVEKLIPVFQQYYSFISQDNEQVSLVYESQLEQKNFDDLLKGSVAKDRALQYTSQGIHKDELVFFLGDHPIRKLGSQGQMKTYLVSLKLAQFDFIKAISGLKPILLLDDIFDKLDQHRVEQIVKVVSGEQFGQIFLTDTNREHLDSIIRKMDADYRIFQVDSGNIKLAE